MTVTLRRMCSDDIAAVLAIQGEYYSGSLIESADVIRARLSDFPDTTWVALDAVGICAYLVAYRTKLGSITMLGSHFMTCNHPDSIYLHDVAVARRAAGRGVGSALAALAWETAERDSLPFSSLVSLPSAVEFWIRAGYHETALTEAPQIAKLKSYGAHARYMVRVLSSI